MLFFGAKGPVTGQFYDKEYVRGRETEPVRALVPGVATGFVTPKSAMVTAYLDTH